VSLTRVGERWAFRTAADLAPLMRIETSVRRKLSRAAVETLAVVAYHQPVTRAEIEEIRGVGLSRGTLDVLLEAGWIKPRGRRKVPGRPVTWGTTPAFLDQMGLEDLDSLPGRDELKAAGLLDTRPAIAVLASRGELEEEAGDAEEDGEDSLAADEALAADFGDDLVAEPDDGASEAGRDAGDERESDEESGSDSADRAEPESPRQAGAGGSAT
jgi:segregation and condensation protein B